MKVTRRRRILWRLLYDDPRTWHTLWRWLAVLIPAGALGATVWVRWVYR